MAFAVLSDRRACTACHGAKRKCSKSIPACKRCTKQGISCEYPSGTTVAFTPSNSSEESAVEIEKPVAISVAGPNDWGGSVLLPDPLQELCANSILSLQVTGSRACFLSPESFVIDHTRIPAPLDFELSDLKDFLQTIQSWFITWVNNGSNLFIHHRLYANRFPSSVQIAFTTLSAYVHRTSHTTDMVLRTLNDRASELFATLVDVSLEDFDVMEVLALVHASFAYQVMGLLDGDSRVRHIAEQQTARFRILLDRMLDIASVSLSHNQRAQYHAENTTAVDRSGTTLTHQWHGWMVAESLRRTWLLATGFLVAYEALKTGWTTCAGDLMITNREGLWAAQSAHAWHQKYITSDVRFFGRFHGEWLFGTPPEEVDDFGKLMLQITYGKDKYDSWIGGGKSCYSVPDVLQLRSC